MAEKMDVEARIAHCLRLAQDPGATRAERDLAGQEAERLLAKHAIDRLDVDVDGDRLRRDAITTETVVVEGGEGSLALDVVLGLAKVTRSLGLVPHYLDRRRTDPGRREAGDRPRVELRVTGFRQDVDLALPLLQALRTQAMLALHEWWRGDPDHRGAPRWDAHLAKRAFVVSFGEGAAARLQADRDTAAARTGKALVVASREREVQDWVRQHLTLRAGRRRSTSAYGRTQGYRAGYRSAGPRDPAVTASSRGGGRS